MHEQPILYNLHALHTDQLARPPPVSPLAPCSYKSPFAGGAQQDAADRARAALAAPGSGTIAAGQQSDHLLMVAAVDGWLVARAKGGHKGGCCGRMWWLARSRGCWNCACLPRMRTACGSSRHAAPTQTPSSACTPPYHVPRRCSGVQPAALPFRADARHAGRHAVAVCNHAGRYWGGGGARARRRRPRRAGANMDGRSGGRLQPLCSAPRWAAGVGRRVGRLLL